MASPALTYFDKCVAYVIVNSINEEKREWRMSDQKIVERLGGKASTDGVFHSRKKLRAFGLIAWKRSRDANIYFLPFEHLHPIPEPLPQAVLEPLPGTNRLKEKERKKEVAEKMES
jgi:hypothetical protein